MEDKIDPKKDPKKDPKTTISQIESLFKKMTISQVEKWLKSMQTASTGSRMIMTLGLDRVRIQGRWKENFHYIDGEAVPYRGVWQGTRVSTNGEEERPY